ncbi:O-antigen ligase family protein [Candidatus Daviesbacteria bacterium]|nr:O-antigen ligase family protein [Candidatus Daviesbacteria bacterium]
MTLANLEKILFFLTILFLPTQLGRHFWPQFSFIYSLPIDYLSPTLYFWDILAITLWTVFLIRGQHINRLAINLFYFFILTQSLSLLPFYSNSLNIGAGLVRLEQYTIAGLFGVYIASSKFKTRNLFWLLSLAVIGESLLGILQFFKGGTLGLWILGERSFSLTTPAIAKFDFYGREFLRPYATFPHPNLLAAFLIITLTVLLPIRMTVARMAVFLAAVVILLTVSRAAIVAGLMSSLFLFKKRGRILLILTVLILSPVLFTRFSSLIDYDSLTFIRREQLSKIAISLWLKSPILGVGLNNFIPQASDLLLAGPSRFLQPVHNIFLLALAETGMLGFLGLLGMFGFPILRLVKLPTKNYQLKTIFSVWGVIIFLGLFDHYFLSLPQGYRLLFLIWGLSFSMLE